ncbi:hypothetical protein B5E53_04440 [Eubacterium sp. An11]|nr:hypothetical protein B5E53_04440 [Eubacterium sp. An11]
MGSMKRRLRKVLSLCAAFFMVFSTMSSMWSDVLTVHAATTVRDVKVDSLKSTDVQGYHSLDLPSNTSGIQIETSDNLTKAKKTGDKDWIWEDRDQGAEGALGNLGDAYISNLTTSGTYWIQYNNIDITDDGQKYDVRVVFDNAKGTISNAEGCDIAVFDGQLGAVRFRGYKSLDCSIYVYEHGTKNMVEGSNAKMHLRFIDIDCNQAVEVLSPGRVDWAYKAAKLSWAGAAKCNQIGATEGNTVWYDGPHDERDDNIQLGTDRPGYKSAKKYTLALGFTPSSTSNTTFKVRYYSGGADATGTQTNGAFFSFDGNLDLDEGFFEADIFKQVNDTTDITLSNAKEVFTYTLQAAITDGSAGGKSFIITDTLEGVLTPMSITGITVNGGDATGNFDYSINGQTVTVSAKSSYLVTNPTGTVSVNIAAKIKADANLAPYYDSGRNYAVIPNSSSLQYVDPDDETYNKTSNQVTVRVPLAELTFDKVADAYEYKVGDTVTYTISVKNVTDNSTAYDVVMTDAIPSDLQVNGVTPSAGSGSVDGQNVRVTGANLGANQTLTVKVNCKALESGNTKELYNTASATCWNIKNPSGHADDDAETYINSAVLTVDKTVDRYEYEIGDTATFTVKVTNTSKGTANNVVIADDVPEGMTLDYDSVKISGLPETVVVPVAGTNDPTNTLNPEYRNETETRKVTAGKAESGDNGWKYTINHFPAGATATITYTTAANEKGNGEESRNMVTVTADNAPKVQDEAEYYINTAKLTIDKSYINPYKTEKNDNRCDNEFRIYEEETGYEKVQYQVVVTSAGADGTVAKDVVIDDLTLPDGLELNYDDIVITETAADGTVLTFEKASGGDGKTIQYKIAGTEDETNTLNPELYDETEDRTPVITIEKSGNGFIVKDTYLEKGAFLTIKYDANALENEEVDVNGTEITNTAKVTAANVEKAEDGSYEVVKDTTTVYINSPRLQIVKKADSDEYEIGDNVSYTIDVINTHKGTIARNLVFTDKLETEGVEFLTGTIALYDTNGYELREGTDLAGEDDYIKTAKIDAFILRSDKHLVVDGNYDLYDLENGKNPEEQGTWNPPYVNVTSETKMSIKYDMKITDKDLAGKEILNTATAVSDEALKVTTDETVIPDGPNPKVEKEIDNASPVVGKDVTFTLTFTNPNQNTTAEDVQITDALDQTGMVTIYADSMSVKLNNEDVTEQVQIAYNETMDGFDMDTGLDLTEDDTLVVTYRAKVLPEAGDVELVNTAGVSCSNNPEWKYDSVPFIPEKKVPKLAIEKTSDQDTYQVGDTGHYTVNVTQTTEDMTAKQVVIKDALQAEGAKIQVDTIKLYFNDVEITPANIISDVNGYTIETGKDLSDKDSLKVTYDVYFESGRLNGQTVPNTAKAKAENTETETDREVPLTPVGDGLEAKKEANPAGGTVVKAGDTIQYTITVKNISDQEKTDVLVRDAIPELTTYVEGSGGELFTIDEQPYVRFVIPVIAAGEAQQVFFSVTVNEEATEDDVIKNTAQVYEPTAEEIGEDGTVPEKIWNSDRFEDTNTITHPLDDWVVTDHEVDVVSPTLAIEKTSDKDVYQVGETGHYTVTVTQTKEDLIAKHIIVKDNLQVDGATIQPDTIKVYFNDTEITPVSVTADSKGYLIDTGMDLTDSDAIKVLYDVVFVEESLMGGMVPNTAKAKADNAYAETDHEVPLTPVGDGLTAKKEADPVSGTVVEAGGTIQYTITVKNTSDKEKTNILVRDAVPEYTTYVESSGGEVFMIDEQPYVRFILPSIAAGEAQNVSFSVTVNEDVDKDEVIKNVAQVYEPTKEEIGEDGTVPEETWNSDKFHDTNDTLHPLDNWIITEHEVGVGTPDVSIEKKADATVYSVGETIQYTIAVSQNTEGATATNVIVEDKDLTKGVDIDYASIQVDGAAVPEKDEVERNTDSIHLVRTDGGFKIVYPTLSGQSEITFHATITSEDLTGQKINNTATVITDQTPEKEATVTVKVPKSPLEKAVEKTFHPDGTSSEDNNEERKSGPKGAKTGVTSYAGWFALAAAAFGGAGVFLIRRRRKKMK